MRTSKRLERNDYIWRLYSKLAFTPTEIQAILLVGGIDLTTMQISRIIKAEKTKHEKAK